MRISPRDQERVLAATDLLKLVEQYTRLRRSGKEHFALCPFHKEETPSFTVNPDKQKYLCRGCWASGDAVGFLMKTEGLSYPAAVRSLAARAGITLDGEETRQAHTAAASLSAEARWFWADRRRKYSDRQARAVDERNKWLSRLRCATDPLFWDALAFWHRYARQAKRWDRLVTWIDTAPRADLLDRYIAHRQRHPRVYTDYRKARELEAACLAVETRAVLAVGKADIDGLITVMAPHLT